jgi:hypothetical protein
VNKRFDQLDSLRGLAALAVLLSHFMLVFPSVCGAVNLSGTEVTGLLFSLTFTPLHVFWAGHEAVILFFVLSGFVLALPFLNSSPPPPYRGFLIKRLARIYPPYFIAVLMSLIINKLTYHGGINGLSVWFNNIGQSPVPWQLLISHFSLIGSFDNCRFDPVLWSMVHEIRISLLFPIIVSIVNRWGWKFNIMVAFLLGFLNWYMMHLRFIGYVQYHHDYFDTIGFSGFFILGALLAKNLGRILRLVRTFSRTAKFWTLLLSILAYSQFWWLAKSNLIGRGVVSKILQKDLIHDWVTALGVSGIMLIALASQSAGLFLRRGGMVFLGKISYSLYLYHVLGLVLWTRVLYGIFPISGIFLPSLVTAFFLAILSYCYVEVPSINLGKFFLKRLIREYPVVRVPL